MAQNDDCQALTERLRSNKKSTTFADVKSILEAAGFTMHPRKRGSHRAFSKAGCFFSPSIPEGRGPLLVAYVRKAIQALEECCDD